MMMMEPSENYEYILYLFYHHLTINLNCIGVQLNFVGKSVKLGSPNIALCCIIMDQSVNLCFFFCKCGLFCTIMQNIPFRFFQMLYIINYPYRDFVEHRSALEKMSRHVDFIWSGRLCIIFTSLTETTRLVHLVHYRASLQKLCGT